MAYSNYFNSGATPTSYANITTYYTNSGGAYGVHCGMSYSNYANATHNITPTAFDIGIASYAVFDSGAYVKDSVAAIKAMRNAIVPISEQKVNFTTGKAQAVPLSGTGASVPNAGSGASASDWPNSALSNAELAAGKTMRVEQIQSLINVTKDLWDVVQANNPPYSKPALSRGDVASGQMMKDLATKIQAMANCTQSNYVNKRFEHNGYIPGVGENGDKCSNNATANTTYYYNGAGLTMPSCTQGNPGTDSITYQ